MVDLIWSYFSLFENIVLLLIILSFAIQIYFYVNIFGRTAFRKQGPPSPLPAPEPVSVIICAKNEIIALQENLSKVLEQDYPEFEVIVVNDCSEDDSEILLASMQEKNSHLIFRTIVKDEIFKHNKKMALGVGIKAARYDLLLFIDADCYPSGPQWLRTMQGYFTEKTEVVLGYTRLENNLSWIRADRFMQALHYLGKALQHHPYMGVGSNLAYRKKIFFDNKGFDIRITGNLREDRIFINKIANGANTAAVIIPEGISVSTPHIKPERWRRERLEELRSFALCASRDRYPELPEVMFRLIYFTCLIIAIVQHSHHHTLLFSLIALAVARLTLQIVVFQRAQKRLGEKGLLCPLIFWDIVFPLVYIGLIFTSHLPRKKSGNRGLWT